MNQADFVVIGSGVAGLSLGSSRTPAAAESGSLARPVGGADGLSVAALCDVVVAGHGHGAESNAGNDEAPDRDVFHKLDRPTSPVEGLKSIPIRFLHWDT
jgi:hypothetical protein